MKKTIVCFGDSNTHGYKSADGGRFTIDERWPGLLSQYLGEDYLVCEEGMSGRTTVFDDPLFEGLNGLSAICTCLMTHEPVDLLIIMLGTNDTKERFSVNAANIAKGLERLTAKAIAVSEGWRKGKPNILIVAPAPIEDAYEGTIAGTEMGSGCAEKSKMFSFYFKQVAERMNCHFVDAGAIPGIKMHPNDYMHLDESSHRLLAEMLADVIPGYFPE